MGIARGKELSSPSGHKSFSWSHDKHIGAIPHPLSPATPPPALLAALGPWYSRTTSNITTSSSSATHDSSPSTPSGRLAELHAAAATMVRLHAGLHAGADQRGSAARRDHVSVECVPLHPSISFISIFIPLPWSFPVHPSFTSPTAPSFPP